MAHRNTRNPPARRSPYYRAARDQINVDARTTTTADARGVIVNEVHGDQFNNQQSHHYYNTGIHSRTLCTGSSIHCVSAAVDLDQLLAPVADAGFNRGGYVPRCHPGTREELIQTIISWIHDDEGRPILWLNGPAGSGKSAASQAIAEKMNDDELLGASFYFLRGQGRRSQISHFIPTLAYQLSISFPLAKQHLQTALRNDRHITQSSLRYQFQKLMIDPFNAMLWTPNLQKSQTAVVVVDALDECNDRDKMAEFIEVVSDLCQGGYRFPFRLLFTSRVEEHIRRKLESPRVRASIYHLSLLNFDARRDIRTFLRSRFSTIHDENRLMRNIPKPWPSERDLDLLVTKASGSFIFASTLIKFVDHDTDRPDRKLRSALGAHVGLDPLYHDILSSAHQDAQSRQIIGTIMLLKSPSSITGIAMLLQVEPTDVLQVLLPLQSIILTPGDDDEPVQLFHTSLRDFLLSNERSVNFAVDQDTCHGAICCSSWRLLSSIPSDIIFEERSIREYCCRHWVYHFNQLSLEQIIRLCYDGFMVHNLMSYLSVSFNHWVNTLINSRSVDENLGTLGLIQTKLQVSHTISIFQL